MLPNKALHLPPLTAAIGRFLPFVFLIFERSERPLLVQADIQNLAVENRASSGRFTLHSGRSRGRLLTGHS